MDIINVTAAIIRKGDKFLIAKRGKGKHLEGMWEFPGGKVEFSETPEECLKRELEEEFGVISRINSFVAESVFNYGDKTIRLLGYNVEYISGEFKLNAHEEIRWISTNEFDKFNFAPADLPLVRKITLV